MTKKLFTFRTERFIHAMKTAFILFVGFQFMGCVSLAQRKGSSSLPRTNKHPLTHDSFQKFSAFKLDVGDVISVSVHGENGLKGKYQIFPECLIQFPMIREIKVCGKTPGQLQSEISKRLFQGFFRSMPSVTVNVQEFNSKKIHVFGEVKKPGRFDYATGLTLLQAVALAEGFTRKASRNDTRLIRKVDGQKKVYRIPLGSLGKKKIKDLELWPGDIVYIPESWL